MFTWLLYVLCGQLQIEQYFLEVFAWVGLWTALLLFALAATDASCLLRYFTRFTDEIFAALISIIFIYAAVEALASIVSDVYQVERTSHDKALVPLILAMGTFLLLSHCRGFAAVATCCHRFASSLRILVRPSHWQP